MDTLIPIASFLVMGIIVILLLARYSNDSTWVTRLLITTYLVRIAVATLFYLYPNFRIFHDDAEGYEAAGLMISAGWAGEGPPIHISPDVLGQNYGYSLVTAFFYYVFGRFPPVAAYANGLFGVITVFVVYKLTRRFFHRLVARLAALLTAFFPSMILWGSVALKDELVTLLIVLTLLACLRLKERFTPWTVLAIVLPLVAIQPIRFYVVYFLIFAIVASLFFETGIQRLSGAYKQFAVLVTIAGLLALTGLMNNAERGLDLMNLRSVSQFRQGMASTAQSGFAGDVDVSNPLSAILFLPWGMSVLLLGPFPWQFTSLRSLFAAPEMIIWWALVPSLVRGLRLVIRARLRHIAPILLFTITLTCSYSLVHGNVGSAFRQRAQIFVFLFIFAALGWYQKKLKKAGINEMLLLDGDMAQTPQVVGAAFLPVVRPRGGAPS